MKCSICSVNSSNRYDLMDHLYEVHSIKCIKGTTKLPNVEAFETWKTELEEVTEINFSKGSRYTRKDGSMHAQYICHEQIVTSKFCPAHLTIDVGVDGSVRVDFVKTHVGHGVVLEEPPSPEKSDDSESDDGVEAYKQKVALLWDRVGEEVMNSSTIEELETLETLMRPIVPTLKVIRDAETIENICSSSSLSDDDGESVED